MSKPVYLETMKAGLLREKVVQAWKRLGECNLCPRDCRVNRLAGETGYCGLGDKAVADLADPHFGEEDCLVGFNGSGTIFFTSCNLKCPFCQNFETSHLMQGQEMDTESLGRVMIGLQNLGCHNVNVVTPSHVVPQILAALEWAAERGLRVPLVYNCGGYDSLETLKLLDGVVDIYMPDLKFADPGVSERLLNAPDYPEVAHAAIQEMHRQVGDLEVNEQGIATRGLLVRHLVMPNDLAGTRENMRFLAQHVSQNTYVNVMNQYRPCGKAFEHPDIARSVTREEYSRAMEIAREEGINRLDERRGFRLRFF